MPSREFRSFKTDFCWNYFSKILPGGKLNGKPPKSHGKSHLSTSADTFIRMKGRNITPTSSENLIYPGFTRRKKYRNDGDSAK
jgi:hypothetical protein